MLGADALRAELSAIAAATSRPVNVNFFCHRPPAPDAAREAAWREVLAPFYAELGVDPAGVADGPLRMPFDDAMADVLEEFRPQVASFHFGLPAPALLGRPPPRLQLANSPQRGSQRVDSTGDLSKRVSTGRVSGNT